MALLSALLATALLMGLGLAIGLIGSTEAVLAAHDRTARSLREASVAAVHLALADLRARPSWTVVLTEGAAPLSASPGRSLDATLTPRAPWDGSAMDLRAMTADVQAAADTGDGDPQIWRLFEARSLDAIAPGVAAGPWYLAVWVADDPADGDGDPSVDNNGIIAMRAVAYGPREARVATIVSLVRTSVAGAPDRVRILTMRPLT